MKRASLRGAILLIVCATVPLACRRGATPETTEIPVSRAAGRFDTEEQWLVARTLQWTAGLAAHARHQRVDSPDALLPFVERAESAGDTRAFAVQWADAARP